MLFDKFWKLVWICLVGGVLGGACITSETKSDDGDEKTNPQELELAPQSACQSNEDNAYHVNQRKADTIDLVVPQRAIDSPLKAITDEYLSVDKNRQAWNDLEYRFERYIRNTLPDEFWTPICDDEEDLILEEVRDKNGTVSIGMVLLYKGVAFNRMEVYRERSREVSNLVVGYRDVYDETGFLLAKLREVQLVLNEMCEAAGMAKEIRMDVDDEIGREHVRNRLKQLLRREFGYLEEELKNIVSSNTEPFSNWAAELHESMQGFSSLEDVCQDTENYWAPESRIKVESFVDERTNKGKHQP